MQNDATTLFRWQGVLYEKAEGSIGIGDAVLTQTGEIGVVNSFSRECVFIHDPMQVQGGFWLEFCHRLKISGRMDTNRLN